jgi:hypothetical protein
MPPQLLLLALLLIFLLRKLKTDSRTTSNQCYRFFVSVLLLSFSLLAAPTIKSLLQNPFHTHSNNAAGVVSRNCQHSSMQRARIYGSNQFATKNRKAMQCSKPTNEAGASQNHFLVSKHDCGRFLLLLLQVCLSTASLLINPAQD